jgi:hypothetical protein
MADVPKYATGGFIPDLANAREDDVRIVNEPGYIITAAMARRAGLAALDRLNRSEDSADD